MRKKKQPNQMKLIKRLRNDTGVKADVLKHTRSMTRHGLHAYNLSPLEAEAGEHCEFNVSLPCSTDREQFGLLT